jgi:protease-4
MTARKSTLIGCGIALFLLLGFGLATVLAIGLFMDRPVAFGGGRVAIVALRGVIVESETLVRELDELGGDASIEAVVLRIDTPGGGIAPSQEIHDAVRRVRERKPVVASMASTAASGGYYVAVACDSIVANPGTLTGSIGVIFSWVTAEELMRKTGVRLEVVKSGAAKDVGNFARTPTEEERALLESVVADAFDQFVDAVVAGRSLSRDEVLALADGRVFTGRQAYDERLVDRLGGEREAVRLAADMAGIEGEPRILDRSRSRWRFLELLEEGARTMSARAAGPSLEYRLP